MSLYVSGTTLVPLFFILKISYSRVAMAKSPFTLQSNYEPAGDPTTLKLCGARCGSIDFYI